MFSPLLHLRHVVLELRVVVLKPRLVLLEQRLLLLESRLVFLELRPVFVELRLVFLHSRLVFGPPSLVILLPFFDSPEAHRRRDAGHAHFLKEQNLPRERVGAWVVWRLEKWKISKTLGEIKDVWKVNRGLDRKWCEKDRDDLRKSYKSFGENNLF